LIQRGAVIMGKKSREGTPRHNGKNPNSHNGKRQLAGSVIMGKYPQPDIMGKIQSSHNGENYFNSHNGERDISS